MLFRNPCGVGRMIILARRETLSILESCHTWKKNKLSFMR